MNADDDLIYLYRGNVNVLGELILRRDLPPGAERLSVRHTIDRVQSSDPAGPMRPVRNVDVFLIQ